MKYANIRFVDSVERELISHELSGAVQPKPFSALKSAYGTVVDVVHEFKAHARRNNIDYANN